MPKGKKNRTVILTNSSLVNLLQRKDMIEAFPRMRGIAKQMNKAVRGCRCGGRAAAYRDRAANNIRQLIVKWPPAPKAKLKQLLKTDVIKIYVGKRLVEF